jgi:hypothetical protein
MRTKSEYDFQITYDVADESNQQVSDVCPPTDVYESLVELDLCFKSIPIKTDGAFVARKVMFGKVIDTKRTSF